MFKIFILGGMLLYIGLAIKFYGLKNIYTKIRSVSDFSLTLFPHVRL